MRGHFRGCAMRARGWPCAAASCARVDVVVGGSSASYGPGGHAEWPVVERDATDEYPTGMMVHLSRRCPCGPVVTETVGIQEQFIEWCERKASKEA